LTQIDVKPTDKPEETQAPEEQASETAPSPEPEDLFGEAAPPPVVDLSKARSMLTELVPAGMGEVLVTDVWARPEPKKVEQTEGEPQLPDRQRAWELRQELRDLGLLKEKPLVSYDARVEQYWGQTRKACDQATGVLLDPYTELVMSFADVNPDGVNMGELRRNAREYGREADALLALGRAYLAIGKLKGARQVFQAAAKAEPQYPNVWWHLGVTDLFTRANAKAAKVLTEAVDQSPGDFRAEMSLGLARYHLRDYPGAEDCFRRLAGNDATRASTRSMLACSLRMQHKWHEARVELGFLRQSRVGDWPAVADQCLDCIERGEMKKEGPLRRRRRIIQVLKTAATIAGGGIWAVYAKAEDLFRQQAPYATIPLFLAALMLVRSLRGISGKELPGEYGNLEQGLPCWQTTTWMKPRRSEF
jgi:tetratricopeptide (TPR) repeat protein